MHRGLLHAFAWTLATGAAVTLSWWGVHTVMSGTAYDPPRAVPLAALPPGPSAQGSQESLAPPPDTATPAPASPSPSASASASQSAPVPPPPPAGKPKSSPPPRRVAGDEELGDVKGYTVDGGRVVFDLGPSSAELVSATPAGGWRMQVWKQDYWIRVTFTLDGREVSVFCTWYNEAPRVQVDDR
ncbi:hypothetical protein ACIA6C_04065 [Streptomyces sp. NPDC051578]|uniref:hypothetical protein n=1 Tax=Streptomyces sp. NPDC051578 TaxID=3365662 RepID=UPI00379765D7